MSSPLNIGIVCYPSIGGSGIVATELGRSLSRRGHQVCFITYDFPRRLEGVTEEFHYHHVDVPLYPLFKFPPYTLALASTIYHTVNEHSLDILHVHYAIPHSTSAFLAKQMLCKKSAEKLKVVTTLHGTDSELVGQMPSYKPVAEFSIESSNAVTAVSEYLKRVTLETFDIEKEMHVIHNPIDTEVFAPPSNDWRMNRNVKTIAHISNFRPVKRILDVIKVFDLIAAHIPARLVLAGEGPDRSAAEWLINQLGLREKVEFAGSQNSVSQILQDADLLLSTSERESFGMAIAEAMACETPVVSTCVGGVPEVVQDGVTGYLEPVGDIQALAQAAIRILSNPQKQVEMGKAARKLIIERFELETITDEYLRLYQSVIQSEEDCA
ncbi:MAG: N-acetyl-alpha-D-glucosaminyl L-malate synthase BshA [Candidatus Omnitrophica bacterium]|nr:N-acetyl-alpha-D-glucosaminyl L-malate synthase BshA [Candidatus Omnitrophota bacterium]